MNRGFEIPKASPESAAAGIFEAIGPPLKVSLKRLAWIIA
jgi:hypothetical protein